MKQFLLFAVLLFLLPLSAVACDCDPCTCDPCTCETKAAHDCPCGAACKIKCGGTCKCETKVDLPADAGKLYVSIYVENDSQLQTLIHQYPEIAKYRQGNHYNVYKKGSTIAATRFKNAPTPSAFVQKADGTVVWSSTSGRRDCCPWKDKKASPPPDEDQKDQDQSEPTPTPVPVDDSPNTWWLLGLAAAGLAAGAGSKFVEELKVK